MLPYLFVVAMFFSLIGCAGPQETKPSIITPAAPDLFDGTIDWNLHGIWVNPDGTVQTGQEGVDFSVSGTLLTEFEPYSTVELALNFTWPDCSIMQDDNKSTYTGHAQFADKHDNQRLYHIAAWLYDPAKNDSTSISFTICPEDGFVVVKLGQDYLVASTDPEADPAEILTFYKEYVHVSI